MNIMDNKAYLVPNPLIPNQNAVIDPALCTVCHACVEVCRTDVFVPNPEKGKPPIVLYPDECWYGYGCVKNCPLWHEGAIKPNHPMNQRVRWKRKATGEHFRIGMPNPPEPNNRPPVGGWDAKA